MRRPRTEVDQLPDPSEDRQVGLLPLNPLPVYDEDLRRISVPKTKCTIDRAVNFQRRPSPTPSRSSGRCSRSIPRVSLHYSREMR